MRETSARLLDDALRRLEAGATAHELENQNLDFKRDGRSADDDVLNIAEATACFANASGGLVVVGVHDRVAGPEAIIGSRLDPDRTRSRIYELTEPKLLVDVVALQHRGVHVLVVDVPASVTVHSLKSRIPTERIGDSCSPMSTDRIASVIAERRGQDWSASASRTKASAVDPVAMATIRRLLERAASPASRRLAQQPQEIDILRGLGVVTDDGRLTNTGALLVTDQHEHTAAFSYVHRRTPTGTVTANEQLTGPLVLLLEQLFQLISARIDTTPVSIGRGQQLHVSDLPEAAIREVVVNAAVHRDYRGNGRVTVEHTQTQLVVTSPGGFVSGVRADNVLTTSSRPRNGQLAGALRALGYAETAGSGVDKMYAEMARLGHQPPSFLSEGDHVRVTLIGGAPNSALTRFVATLPPEETEDADTMTILLTLLTQRTITAQQLVPILQKSGTSEAQSVLERLSSERVPLLEPTRDSSRRTLPRYRLREGPLAALGAAVTYRRRTADQLDRKMIELLRETGSINARMVRVLLDVDSQTTSRLIADLIKRDLLVKSPGPGRGPNVTYGPGTAFPARIRHHRAVPETGTEDRFDVPDD
ncbi:ATP-dependent DNA helicase RecG [Rathayibacter tanaceti]|uniref:Divergent AAA domain protein n=3 Tax=Rathayibacter tanaceti TaxID=1671680 RepID=A0A166I6E9_9MICO|nr:Divergent AAA domain protein [Rathayibacter tanaceti]QHC54222.1 transcriptional regulator [Rathayibacter tanaceti]TCO37894.1 ATP-dependent DNA helicase RecG [Rathayibacter tanaceti]